MRSVHAHARAAVGCDTGVAFLHACNRCCVCIGERNLFSSTATGDFQLRRAAEGAATRVNVDSGDGLQQYPEFPICFDTLTTPSSNITTCCHIFHRECIVKAIKDKSRPACPLCRSFIHPVELRKVMNGIPENMKGQKQTRKLWRSIQWWRKKKLPI